MGGSASCSNKKKLREGKATPSVSLPATATVADPVSPCDSPAVDMAVESSFSDAFPASKVRERESMDPNGYLMSGPDGMLQEAIETEGARAVAQTPTFHDTLVSAANQLRTRQRDSKVGISKAEMEDLVLLTRELENLKQIMKRSQLTVEGTWNILEKEGMLESFAQQLYDELLTKNPLLRVHFYGVDLEEQSQALVRMVGTAVHFYEKPQVTVDMFTKAGARHRGYGISGEVFAEMRDAFLKVFPKFVGTDVFQASEEEWRKFWKLVLDLLQHGGESAEGERYGRLYEEQTFNKIQADFKIITERSSKLEPRQQFVGTMYGKAIEMYGDLSKFAALQDLRATRLVFQSLVDIINNIHDKKRSEEYMLELGARHVAYNVTVENLLSFTDPFLFACRHFLQDEWNVAVESRFRWTFEYMVNGIASGMVNGINSVENMRAPSKNVNFCLLFTDIEASTKLWAKDAQAMGMAVKHHHAMIRRFIAEYGAYEVKTVGDSFIIAAKNVFIGIKISLAIQIELMRMAPIAPDFHMVTNTEGFGDAKAWDDRTLRVRIGVEYCTEATATYDSVHRRYDYYGPSVNRCARIEAAACGGQILLSRQTFEQLKSIPEFHDDPCPQVFRSVEVDEDAKVDRRGFDHFVAVSDVGPVSLKGITDPVHLVSIVPRCLAGRRFIDKVSAPVE